jgi:Domain of unknown function (DUF4926)
MAPSTTLTGLWQLQMEAIQCSHRLDYRSRVVFAEVGDRLSSTRMIAELDLIVLTEDLPEHHLAKGNVGTVVHILEQEKAYEVEFTTFQGVTVALVTLSPAQFRAIAAGDIPSAANHELALAA